MSADALRRSTPSAEGIDARGLEALLDAWEAHPGIRPHGLVVLRHGAVVAEGWWEPYAADRVQLLYSLSKSFTSTAAGLARAEGLLDLDAPVISYFPEYDADAAHERTRRMTVRHIAAMASGHAGDAIDTALAAGQGDLIRGFLRTPPDAEPGTLFAYNQPCTYVLGAIVQRAAGMSLTDYLRPRLLDPLGIRDAAWEQAPPGCDIGFTGLHATTHAVARLGQLYLQRGRWGDIQLLDAGWVDEATRVQVANPAESNPDWRQGYGFQFWMSRHGYRGDGAYGQFCLVLPEQDAVLALTSESPDMQAVLDTVWQHLLPAFDADADAAADERLAARLAGARVAPPALAPHPDDLAGWDGAVFAVADASAAQPATSIREVRVEAEGGAWRLVLVDGEGELAYRLGVGAWAESAPDGLPAAVAGGWSAEGLRAELLFVETPHTLRLDLAPGGTAVASWVTAPLGSGDIRRLRRP